MNHEWPVPSATDRTDDRMMPPVLPVFAWIQAANEDDRQKQMNNNSVPETVLEPPVAPMASTHPVPALRNHVLDPANPWKEQAVNNSDTPPHPV